MAEIITRLPLGVQKNRDMTVDALYRAMGKAFDDCTPEELEGVYFFVEPHPKMQVWSYGVAFTDAALDSRPALDILEKLA